MSQSILWFSNFQASMFFLNPLGIASYISSPSSRDTWRNASVLFSCDETNHSNSNRIIINLIVDHCKTCSKVSNNYPALICFSPLTQNQSLKFLIIPSEKRLHLNAQVDWRNFCPRGCQKYPMNSFSTQFFHFYFCLPPVLLGVCLIHCLVTSRDLFIVGVHSKRRRGNIVHFYCLGVWFLHC